MYYIDDFSSTPQEAVGTYKAFELVRASGDTWNVRVNGEWVYTWFLTQQTWGHAMIGAERQTASDNNLAWGKDMKFRPTDLSAYRHWSNVDVVQDDDSTYAMYDYLTPTYDYLIKVAKQ